MRRVDVLVLIKEFRWWFVVSMRLLTCKVISGFHESVSLPALSFQGKCELLLVGLSSLIDPLSRRLTIVIAVVVVSSPHQSPR